MSERCGYGVADPTNHFMGRDVVVIIKGSYHYWMPREFYDDMDDVAFQAFMDANYQDALLHQMGPWPR